MTKFLLTSVIGCLLVISIHAGPIPDEFKDVAPSIREVCVAETGVPVDLIEKANNGELTADNKLKCYLKCVFDQFRLVNDKKGVNFDVFLKLAPPSYKEVAENIVKECRDTKAETEGDLCDLVFQINKCMRKVAGDLYFVM
ncbi:general odorant-binding protein 83a-like [Chelonus insularis]|uniref:general odorant-binding protein 83a-like n=1 Tax=Chelonus insularis TaxID=460826 RepID=UPI00158E0B83|nr:general odorant-binding protein 83a-like [Chelonus insularis]